MTKPYNALNKIKEIRKYITPDGQEFDSEEKAEKHQAECDLCELIDASGPSWNNTGIRLFLLTNAEQILYLLAAITGNTIEEK